MRYGWTETRTNWPLQIDADMVLRAHGAEPKILRLRQPRFVKLVEQLVEENSAHIRPAATIRLLPLRQTTDRMLLIDNAVELRADILRDRLQKAEAIVAVVGTISGKLDQYLEETLPMSPIHRMILDSFGTAAVTELGRKIVCHIQTVFAQKGLKTTNPIYPGMGGWELALGQAQLFLAMGGQTSGVSLNSSSMMMPGKSVSFLIGIGQHVTEGPVACAECSAAPRCRYKQHFYAS